MLRLTCGPLAHWDVISAEHKRYGRVEVIETVIRRMEQGMRRWGVPVPPRDAAEEMTELALVYDDAEFGSDTDGSAADGADGVWAGGGAERVPLDPAIWLDGETGEVDVGRGPGSRSGGGGGGGRNQRGRESGGRNDGDPGGERAGEDLGNQSRDRLQA
jgi:hypothetical protein